MLAPPTLTGSSIAEAVVTEIRKAQLSRAYGDYRNKGRHEAVLAAFGEFYDICAHKNESWEQCIDANRRARCDATERGLTRRFPHRSFVATGRVCQRGPPVVLPLHLYTFDPVGDLWKSLGKDSREPRIHPLWGTFWIFCRRISKAHRPSGCQSGLTRPVCWQRWSRPA